MEERATAELRFYNQQAADGRLAARQAAEEKECKLDRKQHNYGIVNRRTPGLSCRHTKQLCCKIFFYILLRFLLKVGEQLHKLQSLSVLACT